MSDYKQVFQTIKGLVGYILNGVQTEMCSNSG